LRIEHSRMAAYCFKHVCSFDYAQAGLVRISAYPTTFWFRHASIRIPDTITRNSILFQDISSQRDAWFSAFWQIVHPTSTRRPKLGALHLIAYCGFQQLLVDTMSANVDLNLNQRDSLGGTALIWAASQARANLVRCLLESGAKPNIKDNDGATAMIRAASLQDPETLNLLITKGADFRIADNNNWTPLHVAAHYGHKSSVNALLDAGANVEVQDAGRYTALQRASSSGQLGVLRILLQRGANFRARDREGMTPLLHAAW